MVKTPVIDPSAKIAPNATIVGDVTIGKDSSVFFNAVLRADNGYIKIGDNTNIQDGVIIHHEPGNSTTIGDGVSVGHAAILHGCVIGDNTVVGMGSIIMDGAVIGKNSIVGAGALVPGGKVFPDNAIIMGSPAKHVKDMTEAYIEANKENAREYIESSRDLFGK